MKKSLSIFLCVVSVLVFCAFPFGMAVYADVVSSTVDFTKDVIQNYTLVGVINKYYNSTQKKVEAARSYYFYMICNDSLSSGCTIFDDSGIRFSDDILNFYYEQYHLACSGTDAYYSDGDIYLSAAGFPDVPFSLRLLSFSNWPLTSSDSQDFKNYYNSFLARYLLAQGQSSSDPNPGKSGLDIAPGYVTSEELVEGIEKDNSFYSPKDFKRKISFRNDSYYQQFANFPDTPRISLYSPVIEYSSCFLGGGANDVYFTLFYDTGSNFYNSVFEFHLYLEHVTDSSGNDVVYPYLKAWNYIDGSEDTAPDILSGSKKNFSSVKYIRLCFTNIGSCYCYIKGYKTLSDFLDDKNCIEVSCNVFHSYEKLYLSDFSSSRSFTYELAGKSSHLFAGTWDYHDVTSACVNGGNDDIGLFVSDKPISFTYSGIIDTTKIPSGQIVTISGDTIYNYNITNPETGDSSKFGDYITNNYTYITNNYGGNESGGSGSGVGGNITVGGEIEVGGSVGVDVTVSVPDININVNGNGGAGGSGSSIANPDDFTSADNVDLNKYYDEAVEQSTGFQKFLKDFFGFLPAELLGLILFAVAMAIVCRVFGR